MMFSLENAMNSQFREALKFKIEEGLPGESSHVKMSPLKRPLSSLALKEATNIRESAVAIILYPDENLHHCILIQRPVYDGTHSGQVSFPGGKKDNEDPHLEYTARREAFEEVGIQLNETHLIGELTDVFIPVSGFQVKPYVYYHESIPNLIPDKREVSEIFTFTIDKLLSDESFSSMEIKFPNGIVQKNIPCFELSEKQIWGATALILNELREVILKINDL
jgi:8-oxo-dGTP pyrophosphatase MutT (NUDIX family)